jgi:hypothetical protein
MLPAPWAWWCSASGPSSARPADWERPRPTQRWSTDTAKLPEAVKQSCSRSQAASAPRLAEQCVDRQVAVGEGERAESLATAGGRDQAVAGWAWLAMDVDQGVLQIEHPGFR